jgi:hypothetical protein
MEFVVSEEEMQVRWLFQRPSVGIGVGNMRACKRAIHLGFLPGSGEFLA